MDGWKKTTNITYICRSPKWGFGWIYKSNRPLIIQQTEFGKHICCVGAERLSALSRD